MAPAQDGSGYGYYGRGRFTGANVAAKKGAIANVIRANGTDDHRNQHAGGTNFEPGVQPIPAGAISNTADDQLIRPWRRVTAGPASRPLRMTQDRKTAEEVELGMSSLELV